MKLTPLLLFLLLLVVLVIAVTTLKNPIGLYVEKEGFVQFKTNVVPQTETVIPPYSSRSIVKLYDNLFIDRKNINIVEVVSSEFTGNIIASTYTVTTGGNVDLTGSSISAIYVQTRDGARTNYDVTGIGTTVKESDESKISSITKSYKSVPFFTSACITTSRYQLFYIPYGTDTYIHGIQLTASPSDTAKSSFKPLNLYSYYIPADMSANMSAVYYTNSVINLNVPASSDRSDQNGTLVTESLYSSTRKVHQLTSDIKYDINSGNVIVNSTNSIIVYNRNGTQTKYSSVPSDSAISSSISGSVSTAWIANNDTNTTQIVYIPSKNKTVILLFQKDSAGRFTVLRSARFNAKTVIGSNGEGDDENSCTSSSTSSNDPTVDPSAVSDYYKWYWYWNSAGPGTNAQYSNNYLLKTQIVPPVCPACPSATCATTASSTDSGTGSSAKKDSTTKTTNTVDANGNTITKTVDTAGDVINKTVDTAGDVINKTVDTTSKLLTSGATGATNLLTSGATGTADLVKSGASGTVDLLKDTGSGVANIAGKTLSTTGNIVGNLTSRSNSNAIGGAGAYYGGLNTPHGSESGYNAPGFSRGSPPIDNYSYYGAMPNKGSNYIPITADFSAFKK
jgi:hypothetical protein